MLKERKISLKKESRFAQLFKRSSESREKVIKKKGDIFDENGEIIKNNEYKKDIEYIVLIVSLSCAKCIDLLSKLDEIKKRHSGEMLIISLATAEENEALRNKFDIEFITKNMQFMNDTLKVDKFPHIFVVKNNRIISSDFITDIDLVMGLVAK